MCSREEHTSVRRTCENKKLSCRRNRVALRVIEYFA